MGCLVGLQMDNFPMLAQSSGPQIPAQAQANGLGKGQYPLLAAEMIYNK